MKNKNYVPHAWESVNCPFCGSNNSFVYERFGNELQYNNLKCKICGVVYFSPRPKYDGKFLEDAYAKYNDFNHITYEYSDRLTKNWDKEISETLSFIKSPNSVLDVGACMGDYLFSAKKYFKHCYGVEVSEKMASFVENKLNLKVFRDNFTSLTFDEKFSCYSS
ncbi:MAG TPA: class I SAM-dependent methyltransferase [Bacteroidales bacterium]|nr:class I SAM-dependent methyltransferase [Bacteroidales bacterium]